jgi:hypothetical protein
MRAIFQRRNAAGNTARRVRFPPPAPPDARRRAVLAFWSAAIRAAYRQSPGAYQLVHLRDLLVRCTISPGHCSLLEAS